MSGIQNYHHMTNRELAKLVDNNGVGAATPELLEHVALRFIELFRNGAVDEYSAMKVTRVPLVVS
jgi:hypothetical protein